MLTVLLLLGSFITTQTYAQELPPLIPRAILFGNPEKTRPQISPDGTMISYIAPVDGVLNIWVKTMGKDDDRPVTFSTSRGIWEYYWHNTTLLYAQDNNGDENYHLYKIDPTTAGIVDLTPFEGVRATWCSVGRSLSDVIFITMNKECTQRRDLYRMTLSTGDLELVEKNPGNIAGWIIDFQCHARAAKTFIQPDGTASLLFRTAEEAPWQTIFSWDADNALHAVIFGFSPDGSKLYWKDAQDSDTMRLIEYNCATKEQTVLFQDPDYDFSDIITNRAGKLLGCIITRERTTIISLDSDFSLILDEMRTIDPTTDLYIQDISTDGQQWLIALAQADHCTKVYHFNNLTHTAHSLFSVRPGLDAYQLAPVQPITLQARDGLTLHGYLTCPINVPHRNLPLVLLIHGGPWQRDVWCCNPDVQWFANRGYACLQINFRGSTGYGKKFIAAGTREWGGKMQTDLVDAVQWAIDQGIADPQKIAFYGASYGGYAALMGAVCSSDLLCCAIDLFGISDLNSWIKALPPHILSSQKYWYRQVGDPDHDGDFLESRSPLHLVDSIKIPLLIAQGARDVRVKQSESDRMVAALKDRGIPCEYILFSDEGHGFAKPENRLVLTTASEKFLAQHLGGRYET